MRRIALAILCAAGVEAAAEAPLSAIDWLSPSVREKAIASPGTEPPVAGAVKLPEIIVQPLVSARTHSIGTRLPSDSGLPDDLWSASRLDDITAAIGAAPKATLPALQQMVRDLMLARAAPPAGAEQIDFALARVDHLLELAALDEAKTLIEAAGTLEPRLFRRYFDISLITGYEADTCRIMSNTPQVAPTFAARVFCLSQSGDWSAAALTLGTGRALGDLNQADERLLSHFLDPHLMEGEELPDIPGPISPFHFRLLEAVGEPLSTAGLPLAFKWFDLREHSGWKSQLEAAEVLASHGVLASSDLLNLYMRARPSASGGVWDRARAIQTMSKALQSGDIDALSSALPEVWDAARAARTEVALASLWGERFLKLDLPEENRDIALRFIYLSPVYARQIGEGDPIALAKQVMPSANRNKANDLEDVFSGAKASEAAPIPGTTGEKLLRAITMVEQGRRGDPAMVHEGLLALQSAGQEEVARRAALQYLLLDRSAWD